MSALAGTPAAQRLAWVDAMRFLGMWAIYVGHFPEWAGRLHPFVFLFHVPLFFFVAGFFAPAAQRGWAEVLRRQSRRLLLPYLFFSCLAILVLALVHQWTPQAVGTALGQAAAGIRNHTPVRALWFFPCLWVVALLQFGVLKLVRTPRRACLLAAVCLLASNELLPSEPSWFFNVDSALRYWFWYAAGSLCFPFLKAYGAGQGRPALQWALAALLAALAAWVYLRGAEAVLTRLLPQALLLAQPQRRLCALLGVALLAAAMIFAAFLAARALSRIALTRRLGRDTLVLCGTEDVVKLLLAQGLLLAGVPLRLPGPLPVALYSLACMALAAGVLGALLKRYFPGWIGAEPGAAGLPPPARRAA